MTDCNDDLQQHFKMLKQLQFRMLLQSTAMYFSTSFFTFLM